MNNNIKIQLKDKEIELTLGANYSVSHTDSKKMTNRIFKGIEKGILDIPFLIFSTKVNKEANATFRKEGAAEITTYHNLKHRSLPNEIAIPYYDIVKITKN